MCQMCQVCQVCSPPLRAGLRLSLRPPEIVTKVGQGRPMNLNAIAFLWLPLITY
jgi:hypothetical protein